MRRIVGERAGCRGIYRDQDCKFDSFRSHYDFGPECPCCEVPMSRSLYLIMVPVALECTFEIPRRFFPLKPQHVWPRWKTTQDLTR